MIVKEMWERQKKRKNKWEKYFKMNKENINENTKGIFESKNKLGNKKKTKKRKEA